MNDRPIGQMYIYTCISLFKKHLCDFVDLCHFLSLQKTSYEEKTSSVTYSTVSLYRTCVQNQQETNHARVKKKPTRNVSKTVDLKGTSLFFRPSGVVALQKKYKRNPNLHVPTPFIAPSSSSNIFNIIDHTYGFI